MIAGVAADKDIAYYTACVPAATRIVYFIMWELLAGCLEKFASLQSTPACSRVRSSREACESPTTVIVNVINTRVYLQRVFRESPCPGGPMRWSPLGLSGFWSGLSLLASQLPCYAKISMLVREVIKRILLQVFQNVAVLSLL
jgi:hypothetical protein